MCLGGMGEELEEEREHLCQDLQNLDYRIGSERVWALLKFQLAKNVTPVGICP